MRHTHRYSRFNTHLQPQPSKRIDLEIDLELFYIHRSIVRSYVINFFCFSDNKGYFQPNQLHSPTSASSTDFFKEKLILRNLHIYASCFTWCMNYEMKIFCIHFWCIYLNAFFCFAILFTSFFFSFWFE